MADRRQNRCEEVPLAVGSDLDRALFGQIGGKRTKRSRSKPAVPRYSSDLSAAWEVLRFLHEQGWGSRVGFGHGGSPGTYCVLKRGEDTIWGNADDDHAPLAICRAAVRAISQPESQ